jgi:cytochrome subunit of sulfide dehydrogenase
MEIVMKNFGFTQLKSHSFALAATACFSLSGLALAQPAPVPATPAAAISTPLPATAARYLAANCANCHGTDGRAQQGGFNLAGLPKDYIIAQMTAFKTGTRPATIMHQLSKGYSDAQIALMAEYFSKQKVGN